AVPGRVVLERETGQRLLGERLGKYDEGVGVGNARADAHELRLVGGDRVTAAAVEGGERARQVLEGEELPADPTLVADEVGPVGLGGAALVGADGGAL